jgi:hypothetical protein
MNRGLEHTIDFYKDKIQQYEKSDSPYLKSLVGAMKRTYAGLLNIALARS